jgi:hypothetical protein
LSVVDKTSYWYKNCQHQSRKWKVVLILTFRIDFLQNFIVFLWNFDRFWWNYYLFFLLFLFSFLSLFLVLLKDFDKFRFLWL